MIHVKTKKARDNILELERDEMETGRENENKIESNRERGRIIRE